MKRLLTLTSVLGIFFVQTNPSNALVSYVGQETDLAGFRTTDTAKQFDPNSNNIYGEAGYIFYAIDSPPNTNSSSFRQGIDPLTFDPSPFQTISSIPSYVTLTSNGQDAIAAGFSYPSIDDPRESPGVSVSDIEFGLALNNNITQGNLASVLDFEINSNFPTNGLRVGILTSHQPGDITEDIQLHFPHVNL